MPAPSKDKSSYNEEMRLWIAKQSFWHRLKYGRHPGDKSRLFGFMIKAVFFMVVALGLGLGAFLMAVKTRVDSADFAKELGSSASENLGARAIEGSRVDWSDGMARMRSVSIYGGRSNFFSTIEVKLVTFPLEFLEVIRGDWKIDSLEGHGAEVKLRSGAFTDREWRELLITNDVVKENVGSGWMSPAVELKSLSRLTLRNTNIQWGAKAWMAGSLIGCDVEATRRDGKWNVIIEKGAFSQNWIKNAKIEKLVLEVDSSGIRVVEGKLRMPSGGPLTLSGTISSGDDPEFDLAVKIDDFQFKDFIEEKLAMILSGEFSAEVRVIGSTNRKEGLISKGRLLAEPAPETPDSSAQRNRPWLVKFGRVSDKELSVFRAFGDALGADGIRYFTSERTVIDFETSMGNLDVTEISLYDPMVGKLSGAFSYEGRSKLITEGYMILSVKDAVFENNRGLRGIRSSLFSEGQNGTSNFVIELMGSIDKLTERDAQRVYDAAPIDG